MSLPYLSSEYFCFSFCGALGPCLKPKKHKGSDSLASLMGNYHKSYLHAYMSEYLDEWLVGLDGSLKMMLSMGDSQISIVIITTSRLAFW